MQAAAQSACVGASICVRRHRWRHLAWPRTGFSGSRTRYEGVLSSRFAGTGGQKHQQCNAGHKQPHHDFAGEPRVIKDNSLPDEQRMRGLR